MTTPGAVLGVIRAARPQLQNAMERVVFAVHGTFLAAGYSLVATGSNANSSARSTYSMILEERDITNLFPHIREISQMLQLISGV
jgi:proteasome inhibitor subunit 1 (PI31)